MAGQVLRVIPRSGNESRGNLWWRGREYPCALGRGGVLPASRKRERDGASPAGLFPLLEFYYRADRLAKPQCGLETRIITECTGWCDEPGCAAYNSAVDLPHESSAETLWREDGVYDLLIVIGHNRGPAKPGMGSAIFLHLAQDDFSPTRGCVALARPALLEILPELGPESMIRIHAP